MIFAAGVLVGIATGLLIACFMIFLDTVNDENDDWVDFFNY